ncbi:MAG TPA: HNH endonuclease signature motif containing protein [Bradyrhizobium sp.]|nr:HNH endonuclease signature motif containing protein [Bradyrhizobium sp.]
MLGEKSEASTSAPDGPASMVRIPGPAPISMTRWPGPGFACAPYLEPHHLRRLSDGGPDHPAQVIALCPNCHRRVHAGADGPKYNVALTAKMVTIEPK